LGRKEWSSELKNPKYMQLKHEQSHKLQHDAVTIVRHDKYDVLLLPINLDLRSDEIVEKKVGRGYRTNLLQQLIRIFTLLNVYRQEEKFAYRKSYLYNCFTCWKKLHTILKCMCVCMVHPKVNTGTIREYKHPTRANNLTYCGVLTAF